MKTNNNELAQVSHVESNIDYCVKTESNNYSCSIDYNMYFNQDQNYSYDECNNEANTKFFPYIISSGYCREYYVDNWSYFEFKLDNNEYILNGTYTGL